MAGGRWQVTGELPLESKFGLFFRVVAVCNPWRAVPVTVPSLQYLTFPTSEVGCPRTFLAVSTASSAKKSNHVTLCQQTPVQRILYQPRVNVYFLLPLELPDGVRLTATISHWAGTQERTITKGGLSATIPLALIFLCVYVSPPVRLRISELSLACVPRMTSDRRCIIVRQRNPSCW